MEPFGIFRSVSLSANLTRKQLLEQQRSNPPSLHPEKPGMLGLCNEGGSSWLPQRMPECVWEESHGVQQGKESPGCRAVMDWREFLPVQPLWIQHWNPQECRPEGMLLREDEGSREPLLCSHPGS